LVAAPKIDGAAEDGVWAGARFSNVQTLDTAGSSTNAIGVIAPNNDYSTGDGYIDAFKMFFTDSVTVTMLPLLLQNG